MKWISIIILLILSTSLVLAECSDSDNGKNKYDFGTVSDGEKIYEDKCSDSNIKEYFCSMEGLASYTVLPCVNGCKDGACLVANAQPISYAPETPSTNYKLYFYGLIGILIIVGYVYFFKIRNKPSKGKGFQRKHKLEEY